MSAGLNRSPDFGDATSGKAFGGHLAVTSVVISAFKASFPDAQAAQKKKGNRVQACTLLRLQGTKPDFHPSEKQTIVPIRMSICANHNPNRH